jgi:hypothetical protein
VQHQRVGQVGSGGRRSVKDGRLNQRDFPSLHGGH